MPFSVLKKEFLARGGVIIPLSAPVTGPLSFPYVLIFLKFFFFSWCTRG